MPASGVNLFLNYVAIGLVIPSVVLAVILVLHCCVSDFITKRRWAAMSPAERMASYTERVKRERDA
jgi:hypothetical protein